jgi:hypothetical protein
LSKRDACLRSLKCFGSIRFVRRVSSSKSDRGCEAESLSFNEGTYNRLSSSVNSSIIDNSQGLSLCTMSNYYLLMIRNELKQITDHIIFW